MGEKKFITKRRTIRGFGILHFTDLYGAKCSLQKSSSAMQDNIWLGVNDAEPQIMVSDAKKLGLPIGIATNGWSDFPIPEEVVLNTRMHLNQEQAAELIKELQVFVDTGEVGEV